MPTRFAANRRRKLGVSRRSSHYFLSPRGVWAELQALRGEEEAGDDPVFPMTGCNAWKRVKRAARLAGIEVAVSPHFLRYSHGMHALRRGADLATVRDTLGHESIATTGRYLPARPKKSSGDYLPF